MLEAFFPRGKRRHGAPSWLRTRRRQMQSYRRADAACERGRCSNDRVDTLFHRAAPASCDATASVKHVNMQLTPELGLAKTADARHLAVLARDLIEAGLGWDIGRIGLPRSSVMPTP